MSFNRFHDVKGNLAMDANHLSLDRLLGGRVKFLQFEKGYRTAIDPVFLAAAVPAIGGEKVLEIGSGTGAASLCLSARVSSLRVLGLELQNELVNLANQSAKLSGKENDMTFLHGDLLDPPQTLSEMIFDHVMANPPYFAQGTSIPPADPQKFKAFIEGTATLSHWVQFALDSVKLGGTITFIHHFNRQGEVINNLLRGAGDIVIFPLWLNENCLRSKRVLIQGRKGSKGAVRVAKGLAIHKDKTIFTDGALKILEQCKRISL